MIVYLFISNALAISDWTARPAVLVLLFLLLCDNCLTKSCSTSFPFLFVQFLYIIELYFFVNVPYLTVFCYALHKFENPSHLYVSILLFSKLSNFEVCSIKLMLFLIHALFLASLPPKYHQHLYCKAHNVCIVKL